MKDGAQEIASELIKQVAENPKTGMLLGSSAVGASMTVTINDVAMYAGLVLVAISIYNQVMIAIRSHRKNKKNKD